MNRQICFLDSLLDLTPEISLVEKKEKAEEFVFNMDVISAIRHVYHVQST